MPRPELSSRRVAIAGAAIVLAVVLTVIAVFALLHHWQVPAGADVARMPYRVQPQGAPLQPAPQLDLASYRAEKQLLLQSFAWVDRQHGIVRIPIAEAMRILVERSQETAAASQEEPR